MSLGEYDDDDAYHAEQQQYADNHRSHGQILMDIIIDDPDRDGGGGEGYDTEKTPSPLSLASCYSISNWPRDRCYQDGQAGKNIPMRYSHYVRGKRKFCSL
jgi:hypothetical protein